MIATETTHTNFNGVVQLLNALFFLFALPALYLVLLVLIFVSRQLWFKRAMQRLLRTWSNEAAEYDQVLEIDLFPDQTRAMRELSKSSNGRPDPGEVQALARVIDLTPQQVREWIKTDPDCDDLAQMVETEARARDLALQPVRAPKPPNPSQEQ